jgi:hypothetical protein
LIYLIIVVSTGKAAVPVISLAMIGAVYGLQVGLHGCVVLTVRPSSSSSSENSCSSGG